RGAVSGSLAGMFPARCLPPRLQIVGKSWQFSKLPADPGMESMGAGLFQLAVAAQTVMHQPTVVVRPQKLFQLLAAATRQDAVHRYQFELRQPTAIADARPPANPFHLPS